MAFTAHHRDIRHDAFIMHVKREGSSPLVAFAAEKGERDRWLSAPSAGELSVSSGKCGKKQKFGLRLAGKAPILIEARPALASTSHSLRRATL